MNHEKVIENIRTELKAYLKEKNLQSLVIGISGGIDSCLCAVLAQPVCNELGIPLYGVSMPIKTNTQDEIDRAHATGKLFCTDFSVQQLGEIYNHLSIINPQPPKIYQLKDLILEETQTCEEEQKAWRIRNGNIKARLRMIYLYNLAAMTKGMVLSTDNYTEYLLGFSTIMGDWGDFGMIQELYKTEVYDIAEWIANNHFDKNSLQQNTILNTINALATDGLGVTSRGDLGQIYPTWEGSSRDGYKEVDKILQIWMTMPQLEPIQKNVIIKMYGNNPIIKRHEATHFKRNWPVNVKRNLILL